MATALDLLRNKYVNTGSVFTPEYKTGRLQPFLGGGSYNVGKPGELIKTDRGYGGVKSEQGKWREHIFPVALGGTSQVDNINLYADIIFHLRMRGPVKA